jgi:ribosomal protein S8E
MKLLIPLTILVISYIIYYLFYEPKVIKKGDFIEVEDIKEITKEDDKKYKNPYKKQNQYAPLIKETTPTPLKVTPPSIKQVEPEKEVIQKEYLTLEDIKKKTPTPKKAPMSRPFNYEVFLQVKKLLQQASNTYYAKHSIVLNSHIISILPTNESRQKFKDLLMSDFGLDEQTIDEQFGKNRTVWDWVVFLAP